MALCQLCLQTRPLRNSHIIPELLFRPSYDVKHRTLELARDTASRRLLQKGYREPLLCDGCEQLLNDRYEKPFKRVWYDEGKLPSHLAQERVQFTGLDYDAFKLFHLSILWRASASRHRMFRQVQLGPHQERLRHMLLAGNAGRDDRYIFICNVLVNGQKVVDGIIMEPVASSYKIHRVYILLYAACAWYFFVSKYPVPEFQPLALSKAGTQVALRQQITKLDLIADFLADYIRSGGTD